MKKPKPITKVTLDYHDIIHFIEEKYKIDVRDYAGKFHGKGRDETERLRDEWLKENGYSNFKYVLSKPDGENKNKADLENNRGDWAKDSEEMRLRIEINQKMSSSGLTKRLDELVPYLDHWHWMLRYFGDISNGCDRYWYLESILECPSTPDWVKEITQLVHNEFKEYLDNGGGFTVHIEW